MSTSRRSVSAAVTAVANDDDDDAGRIGSRDRSSTGRAKARFAKSRKDARPSSLKTEPGEDPERRGASSMDNGNGSSGTSVEIEREIIEPALSVDETSEVIANEMGKVSLNDEGIADGDENRRRETDRSASVAGLEPTTTTTTATTTKVADSADSHRRTELPCSSSSNNVAARSQDSQRVVLVDQRKTATDREKARDEKRLVKAVEKFSKQFVKSAITLGIIEHPSTVSSGSSPESLDDTSTTSCSCSDCCRNDTSSCDCSDCERSSSSPDSSFDSSSSSSKSSDTDDTDSSTDHAHRSEDSSTSTTVD